jgi:hypothetical protein
MTELEGASMGHDPSTHTQKKKRKRRRWGRVQKVFLSFLICKKKHFKSLIFIYFLLGFIDS